MPNRMAVRTQDDKVAVGIVLSVTVNMMDDKNLTRPSEPTVSTTFNKTTQFHPFSVRMLRGGRVLSHEQTTAHFVTNWLCRANFTGRPLKAATAHHAGHFDAAFTSQRGIVASARAILRFVAARRDVSKCLSANCAVSLYNNTLPKRLALSRTVASRFKAILWNVKALRACFALSHYTTPGASWSLSNCNPRFDRAYPATKLGNSSSTNKRLPAMLAYLVKRHASLWDLCNAMATTKMTPIALHYATH